jgi:CDP-glycerol glycerophosphotransferase (TagB/SpsB family)
LWTEEEWRARLALPEGRPIILFGAGVRQIVPQEPLFLEQIDQAIDMGQLPSKPLILFRPHPNDSLQRWSSVLQRANHVVCDLPWTNGPEMGKTNVTRTDIERLASTLCYSQVHVNTSSTMTVDGAIFDRPQIGPAYDDSYVRKYDRSTRELYLREHYRPITDSGGLALTYTREQLIQAIYSSLQEPKKLQSGRKKIVQEICTYEDGKSTERVARAIREFLHKESLPSEAALFSLPAAYV